MRDSNIFLTARREAGEYMERIRRGHDREAEIRELRRTNAELNRQLMELKFQLYKKEREANK